MSPQLQQHLTSLSSPAMQDLLRRINRGIEKESLRINPAGKLALTPHPAQVLVSLAGGAWSVLFSCNAW